MKINLVQLKRKKRKNGEIPIYLRFTENRKSRYKSTGISVLPKDWNGDAEPTPQVRKSHPRYKTLNNELERLLNEARDAKIQLSQKDNLSLSTVKQELSVKSKKNLLEFAEYYENKLDNENRYWEHRHFKVLRGNLKDFLASKTLISLDLNDLNSNIIDSFQNYLLNDAGPKKKGNSNNTVNKKIQRLKGMVTQATDEGLIEHDPFFKHDPLKKEPTQKAKLSPEQIEAIKNLDLDEGSELWHVRNYFMFSFYNAGIRFGDMCTLKWENLVDGRLNYKMNKTGSLKRIKQQQPMNDILDLYRGKSGNDTEYIFPILPVTYTDQKKLRKAISSKNVLVNRALKDIAELAEIEESVSFHISRHSWAHFALKKDLDLYTISKALGHSDLKITEQYLKSFDEEKLDEDLDGLYT